mmetsp:Transcript_28959/g.94332  ORF Transcript_28959/g.94332 Transcript_28959/m.94332 type:complete len:262 (+) Transcript_28959:845-1630(+)
MNSARCLARKETQGRRQDGGRWALGLRQRRHLVALLPRICRRQWRRSCCAGLSCLARRPPTLVILIVFVVGVIIRRQQPVGAHLHRPGGLAFPRRRPPLRHRNWLTDRIRALLGDQRDIQLAATQLEKRPQRRPVALPNEHHRTRTRVHARFALLVADGQRKQRIVRVDHHHGLGAARDEHVRLVGERALAALHQHSAADVLELLIGIWYRKVASRGRAGQHKRETPSVVRVKVAGEASGEYFHAVQRAVSKQETVQWHRA